MKQLFNHCWLLASLAIGLTACDAQSPASPVLSLAPWEAAAKPEDVRFVPLELSAGADLRLAASESKGLLLLDAQGAELALKPGTFSRLDRRVLGQQ